MRALYDTIGRGYAQYRKPDPRIGAMIARVLGDARHVVNVGAGAGSYEPGDRFVVAVEISPTMIAQRSKDAAPAVQASAMALPFADKSFDAATAFLTTHHWMDVEKGLREMARISRGPCIFLDHNPHSKTFWLIDDYFPALKRAIKPLLPMNLARKVFGSLSILPVPVPHDCTDGFLAAYWRRPQMYLDPGARAAISFFATAEGIENGLARLKRDLKDGTWMRRNGHLIDKSEMDLGYRLVIGEV